MRIPIPFRPRYVVAAVVMALLIHAFPRLTNAQVPMWYVGHDFGFEVIKDMDSRDSLRCLVALDSTVFVISKIMKTTDGGLTWRTLLRRYNPEGYIGRVASVSWPTDMLAFATADSGRLLRSTDGGETRDERTLFDTNSTPYVRMIDSLHGFVYLDFVPDPTTFMTDDGGLTWQTLPVPDPVGYDVRRWVWSRTPAPVQISPSRFICVKEGRGNFTESRMLVTRDRGSTWDTLQSPFPGWESFGPWTYSMRFADSLVGWASLRRDSKWVVSRTTDGGFTWDVVFADSLTALFAPPYVTWAGDSLRVMLGCAGLVIRSTNALSTWTIDSMQSPTMSMPTHTPPHPARAWPSFGIHLFAINTLLQYGIPPATTQVETAWGDPGDAIQQPRLHIVDLRVDDFEIQTRFESNSRDPISVGLFDINGALHYSRVIESGEREFGIGTTGLAAGIYVLRIAGAGVMDGRVVPLFPR